MNVIRRIGDIISSNINSALDKMENPEKMIDLSISEMEDAIREMKCTIAEKSSEIKALKSAISEKENALSRWEERARLAAGKDMDKMAKEAISEKLSLKEEISRNRESLSALENLISSLESSRTEAEAKLREMKEKSAELKLSAKSAREKRKAAETIEKSESSRYERRIADIKAKIDKWEAESDIIISASEKKEEDKPTFEELERQDAIDKELNALKESMK